MDSTIPVAQVTFEAGPDFPVPTVDALVRPISSGTRRQTEGTDRFAGSGSLRDLPTNR